MIRDEGRPRVIPAAFPSPLREAPGVQANTLAPGVGRSLLGTAALGATALGATALGAAASVAAALGAAAFGAAARITTARSNALLQSLELEI